MICADCNQEIPDNSAFCPYCGKDTQSRTQIPLCPSCGKYIPQDSEFCPFCGASVDGERRVVCADAGGEAVAQAKKKPRFNVLTVVAVVLAAAVIVLAAANIYQHTQLSDCINEIENMSSIIADNEAKIEELKIKANRFDYLCMVGKYGHLGYGAYNFKCNEDIVFLKKTEDSAKVTLTAYWQYGGTVSFTNNNSSVADISFDNDSWNESTTMTITPYRAGISTIRFENDVDDSTFELVIVVTD